MNNLAFDLHKLADQVNGHNKTEEFLQKVISCARLAAQHGEYNIKIDVPLDVDGYAIENYLKNEQLKATYIIQPTSNVHVTYTFIIVSW